MVEIDRQIERASAGLRADRGGTPLAENRHRAWAHEARRCLWRLRYGYADLLERTGDSEQAERWFDAVVRLDPDNSTDAADRVAAIRGVVIEYDETEEDYLEEDGSDEELVESEVTERPEESAGTDPTDGAEPAVATESETTES